MGNTMGIDMGNTFNLFAVIAPLDQELLNTSSQAPRGTNDGVCDEVFSSSATSSKRIPGLTRAEKVLPMSVLKVLPMCVPRAVGTTVELSMTGMFQPQRFNMSHNSRRWTPATVWILQKMVWIIEIFGQSPRFSLAETKISPALRFMEIAFWAVFAGISHSAGVQRSDLWVKLNRWGFLRWAVIYYKDTAPTELAPAALPVARKDP